MKLEDITERIGDMLEAQLVSTDYQHSGVGEVWHESDTPLDEAQGEGLRHLSFAIVCRGSPVTGQERGRVGEVLRCKSAIDVIFHFRIRPTDQLHDERLAKRAAREILAAVNDEALWAGAENPDVVVLCRERYSPSFLLDTEPYVAVTVGFTIDHDEEI